MWVNCVISEKIWMNDKKILPGGEGVVVVIVVIFSSPTSSSSSLFLKTSYYKTPYLSYMGGLKKCGTLVRWWLWYMGLHTKRKSLPTLPSLRDLDKDSKRQGGRFSILGPKNYKSVNSGLRNPCFKHGVVLSKLSI